MTQYIFYSNYFTKRLHECCRKGASSFINLFMHNLIDKTVHIIVLLNILFTISKFAINISFVIYPAVNLISLVGPDPIGNYQVGRICKNYAEPGPDIT
jgi:hypothetical protein